MRLVVFCPNLIGDCVMATPVLRTLRAGFPSAFIQLVARPPVAAVLEGAPFFDEILRFDPRSKDPALRSCGVIARLRREPSDLAVLLPNSFRSAGMAWLGGAKRRVGYARGGRDWLLTDRLAPPTDDHGAYLPTPAIDYYAALLEPLGMRLDSRRTALYTTDRDEAAADQAAEALGLAPARPLVCLNTGGAFGPAKVWPAESFARVGVRLAQERGAQVLVLCGPAERDAARDIVARAAHPRVVSLADQNVSIGLSKAMVKRCGLLVTTDSGPRHFAAALGVPVVSLFGPTHIAWTRTYHTLAVHLQQPVPCGPCQKPVCPEGHHRCMKELDPESVYAAASRLLSSPSAPSPAHHAGPHLQPIRQPGVPS